MANEKTGASGDTVIKYAAIGVGGLVLLKAFNLTTNIANAFGLGESQTAKDINAFASSTDNFFAPAFWKEAPKGSLILTYEAATQDASDINNNIGWFHYNPAGVIAVFHRLHTQSQVSFLADVYDQKYGQDLLNDISGGYFQNRLSDAEVKTLIDYLKTLPKYTA